MSLLSNPQPRIVPRHLPKAPPRASSLREAGWPESLNLPKQLRMSPGMCDRRVGNLARLQLTDRRAVDPRPFGHIREAQPLSLAVDCESVASDGFVRPSASEPNPRMSSQFDRPEKQPTAMEGSAGKKPPCCSYSPRSFAAITSSIRRRAPSAGRGTRAGFSARGGGPGSVTALSASR